LTLETIEDVIIEEAIIGGRVLMFVPVHHLDVQNAISG
jgi:hypothetical protein